MSTFTKKIAEVYDRLADDWSKTVFDNRIQFSHTIPNSADDRTVKDGFSLYETSRIPQIEEKYGKDRLFLIAGAGKCGQNTLQALSHAGYVTIGFLDNNPAMQGKTIKGVPVYPFEHIITEEREAVLIIANPGYGASFLQQVRSYLYPEENILFCLFGELVSRFGDEYFDIPVHKSGKQEAFLDAGSLDGADCIRFIQWCGGEYSRIVAAEPSSRSLTMVKRNLTMDRVDIVNAALGETDGEADFYDIYDHPGGSGLFMNQNARKYTVPVRKIDTIAASQPITFIKMDIEGSEPKAIRGAAATIKRNRPILAISLYHNEMDIIELPLLIHAIRPDYQYYMRHYSNSVCDLVLYCV